MRNPFRRREASSSQSSSNPHAPKPGHERPPPLPHYDWVRTTTNASLSTMKSRYFNAWDAKKEAHKDPGSPEKQEALADSIFMNTQVWADLRTGMFMDVHYLLPALEAAVTLTEQAAADAETGPPGSTGTAAADLLRRQAKLATCYEKRYVVRGDAADLAAGLRLAEHVVRATPSEDVAVLPFRLTCLADLLGHRFERSGHPEDGRGAVQHAARAVAVVEAAWLADEAQLGTDNSERTRSLDQDMLPRLRHGLAMRLARQASRTGSLSVLEQAMAQTELALENAAAGNVDRFLYMGDLGHMRVQQSEKTGDRRVLDTGIATLERAAAAMKASRDAAILPRILDHQAHAYLCRYQQVGDSADVERAVAAAKAAYNAQAVLGRHHAQIGRHISRLAQAYGAQARASRRTWDALEMATFAKRARKSLAPGHPALAEAVECLADAMALKAERQCREEGSLFSLDDDDWEERRTDIKAIFLRHAYPQRATVDCSTLTATTASSASAQSLEKAADLYREAASLTNAHPFTQIRVCRKLGDLLRADRQWADAAVAYSQAIRCWPRLNPRMLAREDMEYVVGQLSGLGARAANCLCIESRIYGELDSVLVKALEALESGRGILASLVTDISDLQAAHAGFYDRYMELCYAVSSPLPLPPTSKGGGSKASSVAAAIASRNEQVERLQELEHEISSSLPGFQNFPSTHFSSLDYRQLAARGPIVYFSTTGNLTYAFLLSAQSGIEVLQLKGVGNADLKQHVQLLVRGPSPTSVPPSKKAKNNKRVAAALWWLWQTTVEPVLQHLGLLRTDAAGPTRLPSRQLPRIWWVTSGLLGLLPLHAAGTGWGRKAPAATHYTMAHVVSSYIPSLRVLAHARRQTHQPDPLPDPPHLSPLPATATSPDKGSLLIVSMPQTEGFRALNVQPEITGVLAAADAQSATDRALPALPSAVVLSSPSRQETLASMRSADIAHFICHGISEAASPSQSGLELADGRLTVHDLVGQLSFAAKSSNDKSNDHSTSTGRPHMQLAYLSACSTAKNTNGQITDESITVAQAFSLVGVPHVVGTLWEASDRVAARLAPSFYRLFLAYKQQKLQQQMQEKLDQSQEWVASDSDEAVACALHDAIVDLWAENGSAARHVDRWVPFIHMGG